MDENLSSQQSLMIPDFAHPCEVALTRNLPSEKKRAILSLWASDACAVESRPGFRWLPGTPGPILFDHIIRALQELDDDADIVWNAKASPAHGRKGPNGRALA